MWLSENLKLPLWFTLYLYGQPWSDLSNEVMVSDHFRVTFQPWTFKMEHLIENRAWEDVRHKHWLKEPARQYSRGDSELEESQRKHWVCWRGMGRGEATRGRGKGTDWRETGRGLNRSSKTSLMMLSRVDIDRFSKFYFPWLVPYFLKLVNTDWKLLRRACQPLWKDEGLRRRKLSKKAWLNNLDPSPSISHPLSPNLILSPLGRLSRGGFMEQRITEKDCENKGILAWWGALQFRRKMLPMTLSSGGKKKEPRVSSSDSENENDQRVKQVYMLDNHMIREKNLCNPDIISEKSEEGKLGNL